MAMLDDKLERGEDSDKSSDDMKHQKVEVSQKVDGLHQFLINLQISRVKIADFLAAIRSITSVETKQVLEQLKKYFVNDTAWHTDENSEIDFDKFFLSSLFKYFGKQDIELTDWKLLTFFALYTCKQGTNTSIHRTADQIARESSKSQSMKPDLF